ncbi:Selenoprotein [[Clostridium] ultunense Esp]|nr:Selenoprotein [[Clostridium] ultunense Esp]
MSFTEALYDRFGGQVKEVTLITSKGGVFEITVNGKKIYSKKETGKFPDVEQLLNEMASM